ncbi:hypothetical protein I4I73_23700 [Pseudonocardia sp. KRD-184]|uniref:Uncharacterized protein n=1 Tax=Pseudonocardia oceani TaxID=2792013 RepID=A0ABS6UFU9_9PSEU|nr:hypothetical protein [Pseudonocardia oceani]MBW0091859.1 hypothetical protein [Pseudonocardia oceani]MBW0099002.1 hypothetical protein [Pseudonocardia oceani]MBW0111497.1 hypothetical protein [Pseudonocardia oceani]MBW0125221.1 hypothetical protein [Pseudonocardia oceani]MBW0131094.1 hypothetical protein [Pseudonocardia oceani]
MAGHRRGRDDPAWRALAPHLPLALAVTAFVLGLLSIGLPNIAPGVDVMSAPGSPVRLFFGVSEEMNLPTFFSVLTFLAPAALLALAGVLAGGRMRTPFLVVALVLALLGFDDFAALHEHLRALGDLMAQDDLGPFEYAWVLPGAVIGAGVVWAFWRLATRLRGAARRDLLLGIAVFFVASLGFETVNGFLDRPGLDGAPLQIGTHVEEITEDLGMIIVLRGALGLLQVRRARGSVALRVADRSLVEGGPDEDEEQAAPAAPATVDAAETDRIPVVSARS